MWVLEMMTHKKCIVNSIVVRLKAKEIYSLVTQGQKNVKSFLASVVLAGSHIPKGSMACEVLNLQEMQVLKIRRMQ